MGMPSSELGLISPDVDTSEVVSRPKNWPPGFRFHPTDEELVLYYLKGKVCRRRILDMIGETDVYKCEPWELPEKSRLQTGDKQWFFFSPRDKKYPNGSRSNRATKRGYWKATGKDRSILCNSRLVGLKKTLIFYDGRAPSGKRTDWVMHEYTMDEEELKKCNSVQDYYAVYKVYKKSGPGPKNGEQYGATFSEERWHEEPSEDSHQVPNSRKDTVSNVVEGPLLKDDLGFKPHFPSFSNIEEILYQIPDASEIGQHNAEHRILEFINTEDGTEYTVAQLLEEALLADAGTEVSKGCEGVDFQYIAGPSAILLRSWEEPASFSPPNLPKPDYPQPMQGNFVEIHDLLDPIETSLSKAEEAASESFPHSLIDGLPEPEHYHEMSSLEPYYLDSFNGIDASQLDDLLLMNSLDGENFCFEDSQVVTSEAWSRNQSYNTYVSAESSPYVVPPPVSGMAYEGSSGSITETRQKQQHDVVGGDHGLDLKSQDTDSVSWFNSAIYSFLERIPTNSASASENDFINKALSRMSSFGAVRKAPDGSGDRSGNGVAASDISFRVSRRPIGNGGCYFISFLVLMWALLWVFVIGIFVKAFKAFTGRYIS